jgi:4-carboxymuconolactone decarboxylase
MAKVFDFLRTTNDVLTERGIELPLPGQSTTTPETRMEQGRAVQAQIIGEDTGKHLYASALADEQHIQRFLSANCFGDHLTRTGIDVPTRELTFAMLVALGGCDPQVKGHVPTRSRASSSSLSEDMLSVPPGRPSFMASPKEQWQRRGQPSSCCTLDSISVAGAWTSA